MPRWQLSFATLTAAALAAGLVTTGGVNANAAPGAVAIRSSAPARRLHVCGKRRCRATGAWEKFDLITN